MMHTGPTLQMLQNFDLIHPLFYGVKVTLVQEQSRTLILKLNDTNFSFLELLSNSLKIVKSFSIYDIVSVHQLELLKTSQQLEIRMRDFNENITLELPTSVQAQNLIETLRRAMNHVKNLPWAEFSIKNLIRRILNNSLIANIGNNFTIEDLDSLFYYMRIKLSLDEKNKLIKKTVQNTERLNQFDLRRIFKVLLLKEELAGEFKKMLDIGEFEKIGKLTVTLDTLINWIQERQGERVTNESQFRNFFMQIRIPNLFTEEQVQTSERYLNEDDKLTMKITFEEFCCFIFSPLNSAYDPKHTHTLQLQYPLSHYYVNTSFNTYLWGDSLYGSVSIEYYLRALERGCRFIQLNIFDGIEGPIISKNSSLQDFIMLEHLLQLLPIVAFS